MSKDCYLFWSDGNHLAREREAFYFLQSFIEDLMGCSRTPDLEDELARLASQVDFIDNKEYFLHRDFQSRNILIRDRALRIIDFQGGRLGPLGYDVAALLLDPYVALDELDALSNLKALLVRKDFEKLDHLKLLVADLYYLKK